MTWKEPILWIFDLFKWFYSSSSSSSVFSILSPPLGRAIKLLCLTLIICSWSMQSADTQESDILQSPWNINWKESLNLPQFILNSDTFKQVLKSLLSHRIWAGTWTDSLGVIVKICCFIKCSLTILHVWSYPGTLLLLLNNLLEKF